METGLTLKETREAIERLASALTIPRKRFADLYLTNGQNGTQAYLAVFHTKKPSCAKVGAWKLLQRSDVRSYVDLCKQFTTQEALDFNSVSKERVLDEEAKLAFVDMRKMFDHDGEFIPPNLWPEEIARAVAGFDIIQKWDPENKKWQYKYKVKLLDKGRALGRLETVLGMNKSAEMNENDANLFKGFLESIDGKSRGLPSEMENDEDQ